MKIETAPARYFSVPSWHADAIALALDSVLYTVLARGAGATIDVDTPLPNHYLTWGVANGVRPTWWFDDRAYAKDNPDLLSAGIPPFVHFCATNAARVEQFSRRDADLNLDWRVVASALDVEFYKSKYPGHGETVEECVADYLLRGAIAGRDPSSNFSSSFYLEANYDVQSLGINPLFHYLTSGRVEGRSNKHRLGFRYDVIKFLRPLQDGIEAMRSYLTYPEPSGVPPLESLLLASLRDRVFVSVSHDNFTKNLGGLQLCLMRELEACTRAEWDHIHIFPSATLPTVDVEISDPVLGVLWNGDLLGYYHSSAIVESVSAARHGRDRRVVGAVHSLIGHSPAAIVDVLRAIHVDQLFFWVHDQASICASFHLMRNNVEFCGAPPLGSNACTICIYGERRIAHIRGHEILFNAFPITAVAPSEFAMMLWSERSNFRPDRRLVHPHAQVIEAGTPDFRRRRQAPLRVAFLGLPFIHKGWPAFRELAIEFANDVRYSFYHLGTDGDASLPAKFVEVAVNQSDLGAMTKAIAEHSIDVAILWSICPETFSFTAHEAISCGAQVVTHKDSGNIQALVRKLDIGAVLDSEKALREFFASGAALSLCERLTARPTSDLVYSRMTFDFLDNN